ncbi:MAG: DUF4097 family beta strand repeat-containing protein [Oscillospiraceae bacterium]|nr:DUF4097 family beta strand repeat-containing protein [Oscillospiraceae bacterium]
MSKKTKIWLIVATSLVVIGLMVFASVMSLYNWDFNKLSTVKYETNTYNLNEEFSNISINTDTADISFVLSDDGVSKAVCYETEKLKHSVAVQNGTLAVNLVDEREWYEHIGITIGTEKITLYLSKKEYDSLVIKEDTGDIKIPKEFSFENIDISASTGDVKSFASVSDKIKIKVSTGYIHLQNLSADSLDLTASTGNVNLSDIICDNEIKINLSTGKTSIADVKCKNITSNGDTGDILLQNVIAKEKLSIERSTGDVRFQKCDADEIFIKTDTGDVKGNLLTDKVFITQSDTGRIDVPKTTTGGKCEISTDTGDIEVKIH